MAEKSTQEVQALTQARTFRISGHRFQLTPEAIVSAMRRAEPESIQSHFVVVEGTRYPPKQVISFATGLDRADFTSHQARRTLMRLGFRAGRSGSSARRGPALRPSAVENAAGPEQQLTDRLRELTGQWVAVKGEEVLHAADSLQALVDWLTRHGQKAETTFRVPEDEVAASGLAPH